MTFSRSCQRLFRDLGLHIKMHTVIQFILIIYQDTFSQEMTYIIVYTQHSELFHVL